MTEVVDVAHDAAELEKAGGFSACVSVVNQAGPTPSDTAARHPPYMNQLNPTRQKGTYGAVTLLRSDVSSVEDRAARKQSARHNAHDAHANRGVPSRPDVDEGESE